MNDQTKETSGIVASGLIENWNWSTQIQIATKLVDSKILFFLLLFRRKFSKTWS